MKTLSIILLALLIGLPMKAQSGEELFTKNCMACHTIGGGPRVGPDLKGVETRRTMDWIGAFILSSTKLIESGDVEAIKNFNDFNKIKMQDFDLNPTQLADLIHYIIEAGGGEIPVAAVEEVELTAEEKAALLPIGSKLFAGSKRFTEKGVSCFACHHVSAAGMKQGGSLGPDLTNSFTKYQGAAGLKGFIATPSSVVMEAAYTKHPLTQEEISGLVVFLEDSNGNGTAEFEATLLFAGGIILFCVLIFLIMYFWREKKQEPLNAEIRNRQLKVKHP